MNVIGYDPYLSVDAAWRLSSHIEKAKSIDEVYQKSDFISIHVPLTDETKRTINRDTIAKMKDGVKILNFARGELVDNDAIKTALENGKVSSYVVDFPNAEVLNTKGIIAIPHLGASTAESEDNCAMMAAQELSTYLETGDIVNSVNFPNCSLPISGKGRVCILHKNIPTMLTQFTNLFAENGQNIADLINKSKKDLAYTIINTDDIITDDIVEKIKAVDGVLRVRVIK